MPAAEALELLTQAAIQSPYDPAVAAETGRVFLDERQPDAALREFGRALALDPHNAQNYNNRGVALEELGQSEAARMDFEQRPDESIRAWRKRGRISKSSLRPER